MPALCADERLWVWILTGAAGALFAFLLSLVGPNLLARFSRNAPRAARRHPAVWVLFALAGVTSIVGAAFASSAPSRSCLRVSIPRMMCAPEGEGQAVTGEYVELRNDGRGAVGMEGWTLCDVNQNHCYTFGAVRLAGGADVTIWSGAGADTAADVYWGSPQAIWNNEGDVATVRNADGEVMAERACP